MQSALESETQWKKAWTNHLKTTTKKWRKIIYYDKNDLSKYELVSGTYEYEDECLVHTEEHLDRKGLGLKCDLECYQVE